VSVSKRLRFEVFRRDGFACRYCGATASDAPLTIDHVVPVALGGTDDPGNLATACKDCNAGKSSSSPDPRWLAEIAQHAAQWAAAQKTAAAREDALSCLIGALSGDASDRLGNAIGRSVLAREFFDDVSEDDESVVGYSGWDTELAATVRAFQLDSDDLCAWMVQARHLLRDVLPGDEAVWLAESHATFVANGFPHPGRHEVLRYALALAVRDVVSQLPAHELPVGVAGVVDPWGEG
jgi:hypothetical protein